MTGYIKLYRSVFESEAFDGEPFSRREAWIWLVANAAWKPHEYRFKSTMVPIGRGQLPGARKALAKAWGWGEQRVRTYLELLQSQSMIHLDSNQQLSIITICNYDKYQSEPLESNQQLTSNQPATNHTEERKEAKELNTADVHALAQKLFDAGGKTLNRTSGALEAMTEPLEWIANGADIDRDILPTVKRLSLKTKSIATWRYFTEAVAEAKRKREASRATFAAGNGPSEGFHGSKIIGGIVINPDIPLNAEPVLDEWDLENLEAANAH